MIYWEPGTMIYEASSSAAVFEVKARSHVARLALVDKDTPMVDLYKICLLRSNCVLLDNDYQMPLPLDNEFVKFWLTWYNSVICLYQSVLGEPKKVFEYVTDSCDKIGYIKFYNYTGTGHADWIFEASPSSFLDPVSPKILNEGHLRWVPVTSRQLPPDALIGGFEDVPLYIARAYHNGSLCPGKYNPKKHLAFVAWGGREHSKQNFEILCGYNAEWVKTTSNNIPENAFVGGCSEVRGESLYIGRAVHKGDLLPGKVHVLYKTCYLPYQGKEIETCSYEILVVPRILRGILPNY